MGYNQRKSPTTAPYRVVRIVGLATHNKRTAFKWVKSCVSHEQQACTMYYIGRQKMRLLILQVIKKRACNPYAHKNELNQTFSRANLNFLSNSCLYPILKKVTCLFTIQSHSCKLALWIKVHKQLVIQHSLQKGVSSKLKIHWAPSAFSRHIKHRGGCMPENYDMPT